MIINKEGMIFMATKSFTADIKFNRKNADSLIKALESTKKAKTVEVSNVETIKDLSLIKKMFSSRKEKECL
ncbi:hypothetical protein [uncultured Gemella sp.]|uniref:hypothetical protein n=1 Tax=uncultured Gemella sp. TaxID=254352 RepID=UPI0028D60722|nr:hypothetical protein [uncultured Gemella sp.]